MGGWTWDDYDIYVMNSDGTNPRRLTQNNFYQADSSCFIADGKAILFAAIGDGADTRRDLFTVPTDASGPPRRLTTPPVAQRGCAAWCSTPSISLDGKKIAFISDREASYQYDVFTMTPYGTDVRSLSVTKVSRYNRKPVLLPDSKGVIFLAGTERNAYSRPIFSLWQVDVDGKNARRIADSGLFTDPQHWKPTL
jgi:Tol biopolymer transport system component